MLVCLLCHIQSFAQFEVGGTIKDRKGDALAGASVQETGTANGTMADVNGKFKIAVSDPEAKLKISHQGFYTEEVRIDSLTRMSIILEENVWELDNMVVTATRSARDIENVPQKVKVISRKEIDKTIANDVTDVLKKTAGVDVIQYPGLLSGVGIRGFRPQFSGVNQRTLLLIDGRPAGATNLATIDMNNIERVEVLKGPASALYGAQAMGGVINLITKKTKGSMRGQFFGGWGNFNRAEGGFSVGGNLTDRVDYDVSFKSFTQGNDFRLGSGNIFRNAFGGDKATRILWTDNGREEIKIEDDRGDGDVRPNTTYKSYTGAIRVGYDLNDHWRIDVKADRFYAEDVNTPGDIENGSQSPGLKDMDRYGGDLIISGNPGQNNEITAKFFAATEKTTRYRVSVNDTTTIRSTFKSSDDQLQWIGGQIMDRQRIGDHFFTAGIDYSRVEQENIPFNDRGETGAISTRRPNFNQQNIAIYLQGELNFFDDRLNITAGLRDEVIQYNITSTDLFPSRSQSNDLLNPSLGINYNVFPHLFIHGTFGMAFTTLGVFEIAGYDERSVDTNTQDGVDTVDVWIGNPDLENQESRTFDVGLRYVNEEKGFSFDLTYFNTYFENNVINQVEQFPGVPSENGAVIRNRNSYANARGTTLTGLEFDINYRLRRSGISVFANGVYIIDAEEIRDVFRQPQPLTLDMHNVANLNVNYGISYDKLPWLSAKLSGRYVGQRYDTDWSYYLSPDNGFGSGDYADVRYPSFMVMDLVTTFSLKSNQLSLLVGNLTDENYYEKRGFNLMGRNYMLRYALSF